jgi:hypothetical protein
MRPRIRHTGPSADASRKAPVEPDGDLAGWRKERLLLAGFEPGLAESVAADCTMDLHATIELVERGCPPELAARILAPVDHERNPC